MRGALAVVAAVGTLVFVQDSSLSSLSHIAGPLGDARIAALAPPPPVGSSRWEPVVFATTAPAFSPGGSNWARYAEVSDPAGSGQRAATVLDVVSSPGPGPLSAGDLRNWYPISEKVQEASVTTDLGSGVRAAFVSFRRRDGSSWVCLTWIWPVMGTGSARFERVVLIPARLSAVGPSSLASGWLSAGEVVATKPNLKAIARALVSAQLRVTKASSSGTNNWLEAS